MMDQYIENDRDFQRQDRSHKCLVYLSRNLYSAQQKKANAEKYERSQT